jgi:hypothetical protein
MNMIEVIKDLIECMESAIKAGDWKVDGACDPSLAIERGRQAIAEMEQKKLAELEEVMIEVWKPVPEKLKIEKTILKALFPALKIKMSGDKS